MFSIQDTRARKELAMMMWDGIGDIEKDKEQGLEIMTAIANDGDDLQSIVREFSILI